MFEIYGATGFKQWQQNRKLVCDGLAAGDKVRIFNNDDEIHPYIVACYEFEGKVVCDVPNILLTDTRNIKAVDIKTGAFATFNVLGDAKPKDWMYEETPTLMWDMMSDKPFGEKSVIETVILDETKFNVLEGSGNIEAVADIAIGETYSVYYNGEKYECVAFESVFGGSWALGNLHALGREPNTGEPFYLNQEGENVWVYPLDDDNDWQPVVKITKLEETVTPIPKEMLPEPLQFGEERTTLVEEQEITINETEYGYFVSDPFAVEFTEGEEYVVSLNGVEYTCKAVNLRGTVFVGNESLMTEQNDSGEPFIVAVMENQTVLAVSEAGTYTIKISGTVITPINEKYLPESVKSGGCTFVYTNGVYMFHDAELTQKVSKAELATMVGKGAICIIDLETGDVFTVVSVNTTSLEFGYAMYILSLGGGNFELKTIHTSEFVG